MNRRQGVQHAPQNAMSAESESSNFNCCTLLANGALDLTTESAGCTGASTSSARKASSGSNGSAAIWGIRLREGSDGIVKIEVMLARKRVFVQVRASAHTHTHQVIIIICAYSVHALVYNCMRWHY